MSNVNWVTVGVKVSIDNDGKASVVVDAETSKGSEMPIMLAYAVLKKGMDFLLRDAYYKYMQSLIKEEGV